MNPLLRAYALGGVASLAFSTAAIAVPVTGDPVLYWAEQLSSSQVGSPLTGSRGVAMVGAALYDAVAASVGDTDNAFIKGLSTPGGDTRAAASVAAHDLLVKLFPAKAADYGAALAAQLAQVPDGAAKTSGMATGALVANAVWNRRLTDGSADPVTYAPSGLPGRWAPTGPGPVFAFASWGTQDTWIIESGDAFRPDAPPALNSDEYTAAFNQVKELGAIDSATRTGDQTDAANYWATTAGNPMLRLAIALAEGEGLSTTENARLFATLAAAMADSGIATWDAKFAYDFWRPVTGIRNADSDGNDATIADPLWTPLIGNPPYPAYTSGLAGLMVSGASILEMTFGSDFGFCLPHTSVPALDRCWDDFDDLVLDAAYSRIWGGIHWEFDQLAGIALAEAIARAVSESRTFDRIPEPASLALFGFGIIGAVAAGRRRPARG